MSLRSATVLDVRNPIRRPVLVDVRESDVVTGGFRTDEFPTTSTSSDFARLARTFDVLDGAVDESGEDSPT